MAELKKILVAEDELTNSLLLKRLLTKAGYSVVIAHNGSDALQHMLKEKFDVLLTDWMMPQMDGIELIRRVRDEYENPPFIIMVTALVSESARSYALESGADDYVAKPIDIDELLTRVRDGLQRNIQEAPIQTSSIITRTSSAFPPFVGCCIATSTGGPPTLIQTFKNIDSNTNAAFYVVQHGPPWMLETFSQRLQREVSLKVNLASNGQQSEPGNIYIAPGDKHMRVEENTFNIILDDGPKENFVRPSADPLFRSVSDAFGKYALGCILTGLGRDGAQGVAQIASVNGVAVVQNPETAVAPSMPKTIIESGIKHRLVDLEDMGKTLSEIIFPLYAQLKKKNAEEG
jgi:two-component system, chemotaxis family, protein-glutamate methylesterase/glutaminase